MNISASVKIVFIMTLFCIGLVCPALADLINIGNGTITDTVTGLTWEQESHDNLDWKAALGYCDTLSFAGHDDWRMPTIKELGTIVDLTRSNPSVNTYYFTNTVNAGYWTGTTRTENTAEAWVIDFSYGDDGYSAKSAKLYVRAVRGGPPGQIVVNPPGLKDNGDGTITDAVTGLMWQQVTQSAATWKSAMTACAGMNLGSYTDWRLPTIKELSSIASLSRSNPAINTFYFSDTVNDTYWTGTTRSENVAESWGVNFAYGDDVTLGKSSTAVFRAVRGGSPVLTPITFVTFIDNGDGTITDRSTSLMWQQSDTAAKTWKEALAVCVNSKLGGYTDWHVPTIKELATLASLNRSGPAINTFYFSTTSSENYWSSTTRTESTNHAWGVNFQYGDDTYLTKTDTAYVRAVRSGPASGTCFLMGYLTDAVTKKPLAGVTVTVDGVSSDVTDSSGLYYIPGLGCGTHTVSVKVSGYAVYNRTVNTTQSGSLNIALAASNSAYGINTASGYSADPVNTATGNYIYTQRDFEIPGIGLPLVFERTYNSQDETDNSLGYGWNHTYNARLIVSNSDTVIVHWGDGKTETWTGNGSGGYTRQYGVFDDLIDQGGGTFSVNKKDGTRYFFNAAGRLFSITDKNGNEIELVYSGDLLDYIVDTAGRHIDFSYNGNSRITKITDPAGGALQFSYDANGNLVSAANMNGHATTFSYDTQHQMLTVTDPRSNVIVSNTYDADKRVVTSQKDAKQGQTLYVYSQTDRQTTITDALGNKTIHVHDDWLRLVQETDPLNHSLLYAYDDTGNRVKVTDKKGQAISYTYDANGNVLSKTDALNQKVTIEYDSRNNPTRRTDAMGNVTQFQYDSKGNLILSSDALGNLSTQTFTAKGQIQTQTDANGQVTTYGYDAEGNRNLIKKPEGQESRFTYDAVGRQITRTSPLGQVTTYTFDKMGNLLSEKDPYGYTQQYAYDANGNKIKYTDALGKVTQFAYDVKNLLISVTDALNQVRTYTYDALDRKLTETDPNGHTTQYVYDAIGRLIQIIQGQLVTVKTYDANGKQITETNPSGKTSTFGYDALNRLISRSDPLGNTLHHTYDANDRMIIQADAAGKETRFTYDIRGRLTKVQDPAGGTALYTYDGNGNRLGMTDPNGHITQYKYDRAGRLIETTEPLGGKYIYGYDAADNRTSMKDPAGRTLLYKYDNKNRLIQITRGTGDVVTYSYSPTSLKTVMVDSLGTTQYTYDALSRLTAVLDPFGKKVQYAYDKAGNQTRMIYPDGKTVDYAYDSLDRLVSLSDWMGRKTTYQYNAAGDLVTTLLPNGMTTSVSYDAARRMTALGSKKSTGDVVMNYAFTLDAVGNHQSITQTEPLAPVYEAKNLTYTQDVENRLLTAGTKTFTHDANGNMTGATGRTFAYDVEDRLLESVSSGNTQRYSYNGNGLRYTRTESGKTVRYVLDVSRKLPGVIAETSDTGAISAYYVYGLGLTEKIAPDGTAMYYHFDARGSTVAITDGNQNVQATYSYGPFGEKLKQTGAVSNPFTFMGRYGVMDDNNGLYYVRARYYWPEVGRFLNKDLLIGNAMQTQSLHRYVYGLNNPVLFLDVTGLSALEAKSLHNLNISSDKVHDLLSNGKYDSLMKYLKKNIGGSLIDTSRDQLIEEIFNAIVAQSAMAIAANSSFSTATLGKISGYLQSYSGPVIAFMNVWADNYKDTYNHPERDMVEVAARLSIDVTANAISGVISCLSGGTAGFAMSAAYGANREDIQNEILYNPITNAIGSGLYNAGHGNWFGNLLGF